MKNRVGMRSFILIVGYLLVAGSVFGQAAKSPRQAKVMTLGVFHFEYPNLDAVKTEKKDQISVLEEPYQSEILAIVRAIKEFSPTIIAVERNPSKQQRIDSLFQLYKTNKLVLAKDEHQQLAFRIGKDLDLPKIFCVDNMGRHYDSISAIFKDDERCEKMFSYTDSAFVQDQSSKKVSSIIDELLELNNPNSIRDDLSGYLMGTFKYEEQPYDFTGVDFQTGRWFNRNLRIFRNIQRIPHSGNDRILLIFGAGHLNLLNYFFEVSKEFEFVSPLPFLEKAKKAVKK